MPARGRHRRPKPRPVSRASLAVTAGGAGLALPLVAASDGQAAPQAAEQTVRTHQAAPGQGGDDPRGSSPGRQPVVRSATDDDRAAAYEVEGGDTLSSISRKHRVTGGWKGLYRQNSDVVGDDPDLIFPGQRLTLREGGTGSAQSGSARSGRGPTSEGNASPTETAKPDTAPAPAAKSPAPKKSAPKREAGDGSSGGEAKPRRETVPKPAFRASAPVPGAGTGTPYRATGSGWSSGHHTGIDFPVPTGTGVRAVADASVVSAGWAGAYGYQVVLRHDDGRFSQYAHLSAISVAEGQRVHAGQRLGRSGSTGNSTGPHLHFEVRTGPGYGSDIDPLAYLRKLGVSL